MGPHLDYRLERWAHVLGTHAANLAASTETPDRWARRRGERETVISAFLAATSGLGTKAAQARTGVNRNVLQRLRAGTAGDVKTPTLDRMRRYLEEHAPIAAAAA